MQHLRGYHNFDAGEVSGKGKSCPYPDCEAYRAPDGITGFIVDHAFKKQSDYTSHMKKVHDESPFPCDAPGCSRVGGKGFSRQKDLLKHVAKMHKVDEELELE